MGTASRHQDRDEDPLALLDLEADVLLARPVGIKIELVGALSPADHEADWLWLPPIGLKIFTPAALVG